MDVSKFAEGQYINAEIVKNSPTRKLVIVSEGEVVDTKYGEKLEIEVELDKKKKKWKPNVDSMKNMITAWGKDNKAWIGNVVKLKVLSIQGKETVIAEPIGELVEKPELSIEEIEEAD